MRHRNYGYEPAMRQRTKIEVATGSPSDEEEFDYSSKQKKKTPKANKRRRKHCRHPRVYLLKFQGILEDYLGPLPTVAIKRKVQRMTVVQWTILFVGLLFLGFPLLLFCVSERKVIKEHAIHYDVLHCPPKPPADYPREYPILDVLHHWPTDKLTPPTSSRLPVHRGICVFDMSATDDGVQDVSIRQQIQIYREREVPFVIRNDPDVLEAVQLFGKQDYLSTRLANKVYQATLVSKKVNQSSTSKMDSINFDAWNSMADNYQVDAEDKQYASLRLDACLVDQKDNCDATYINGTNLDNADFFYDDLPFFRPSNNNNNHQKRKRKNKHNNDNALLLYDTRDRQVNGIQCQFASPGFLSETQLDDEGGNYIAMLGGSRRFLLAHPRNCPTLYLLPEKQDGHSYHSQIHLKTDWIKSHNNKQTQSSSSAHPHHHHHHHHHNHPAFQKQFPDFHKSTLNEVVLEAGDVLYLPTHWFHHVVSLTKNYQCKTPTAHSNKYEATIRHCLK